MISFSVCRKCDSGNVKPGKKDDEENFIYYPTVECEKAKAEGFYLVMASDVPKECPYAAEHMVLCQSIPEEFARSLGETL